jgi:endonuclease-3 related protein
VDGQVGRLVRRPAHGHRHGRGRAGWLRSRGGLEQKAAGEEQGPRERPIALNGASRLYNELSMLVPPPLLPRPAPRRRRLLRLYDRLHRRYGPQHWWPARSRFEIVVGAILTQNAAWRNAERAIARLRAAGALDLRAVLALPPARIATLLRPSGTFRVKAQRLRAFARHVAVHHGARLARLLALPLPVLRAELRGVPGIGPETADAITLYAAGRPIFVVDAYTTRILARHRLVAPDADYAAVQTLLMSHLPHDPALFNEYHALLVRVGKEHCGARPRCEGCPLRFDLRGRPPHVSTPRRRASRRASRGSGPARG